MGSIIRIPSREIVGRYVASGFLTDVLVSRSAVLLKWWRFGDCIVGRRCGFDRSEEESTVGFSWGLLMKMRVRREERGSEHGRSRHC